MAKEKKLSDYKSFEEWDKATKGSPNRLEDIVVTATRLKSRKQKRKEKKADKKFEKTGRIEEIKVTSGKPLKQKILAKKAARARKRAELTKIRREAKVDRLERKMETAEQKRNPYRLGGIAKPN